MINSKKLCKIIIENQALNPIKSRSGNLNL